MSFVGQGWAFPLRLDRRGGFALVGDERELEEAMQLVLATAYGERPMRPDFGCGIHDYVFAPADATTAGMLAFEVRRSLQRWEPRVEVTDVVVTLDEHERTMFRIDVRYRVRSTNDPRNLVFPFYVIPPEES
jgi:phage baseplate assembly protein W